MFFIYLFIFLFGLCCGSFASVIIHRLHTKKPGIWFGRSHCPKCKHTLGVADLFPLFSFLSTRGKCRHCRKPIPIRYPILELIMGLSFLMTTMIIDFANPIILIFYLFVSFIFVILIFYDILYLEVPDEISLPMIVIVGFFVIFFNIHTIKNALIGFAIPVVFFGALFLGSKGRWLGGGDIRIGAIMGFLLGWPHVLIGLFLSYMLGSIFSIIGIATKRIKRKSLIPFVPFLLLGTYIAMFWGEEILKWYWIYN